MDNCPVPLGKSKTCADAVRLKRVEYTLQFCSLAVLYYDYMLTLPSEIKYIWLKKWRLSTVFYFFCRYALVANLLYLLSISENITGVNCNIGYMICGILSILGHIGIIAVWTLRTCAVYGNNRFLFAFFGALGTTVVALLIARAPFLRCTGQKDMSKILGANGAIMLFIEIFSFLLATYKAWRVSRQVTKKTDNPIERLNDLIMSQGIFYIGGVTILSTGVLILNFKAKNGFVSRLLNGLKLPLSGFLTARFMLRLRAWNGPKKEKGQDGHTTTTVGDVQTMQFGTRSGVSILQEFGGEMGSSRAHTDDDEFMSSTDVSEVARFKGGEPSVSSFGTVAASLRVKHKQAGIHDTLDLEGGVVSPAPPNTGFLTPGK